MQLTVELPNDLTQHPDAPREALEAFVAEAYRTESLYGWQCAALLGLSRFEFYAWRKARDLTQDFYGVEELQEDIQTGNALRAAGFLSR